MINQVNVGFYVAESFSGKCMECGLPLPNDRNILCLITTYGNLGFCNFHHLMEWLQSYLIDKPFGEEASKLYLFWDETKEESRSSDSQSNPRQGEERRVMDAINEQLRLIASQEQVKTQNLRQQLRTSLEVDSNDDVLEILSEMDVETRRHYIISAVELVRAAQGRGKTAQGGGRKKKKKKEPTQ